MEYNMTLVTLLDMWNHYKEARYGLKLTLEMFYKLIQIPWRKVHCQICCFMLGVTQAQNISVPVITQGEDSSSNKLAARVLWTHGLWAIFSFETMLSFASP